MAVTGLGRSPRRYLFLGALATLTVLIGLFGVGLVSYGEASKWVDHTISVLRDSDDWLATLLDAETRARGYLLAPTDSAFSQPFESALRREREQSATVRAEVTDNPTQMRNVVTADEHAQEVVRGLRELVRLVAAGKREGALAHFSTSAGNLAMDAFRRDALAIRREEEHLLASRRSRAQGRADLILTAEILLAIGSAILLAYAWVHQRTSAAHIGRIAELARQRLAALSGIAGALSDTRSPVEVADVIVASGTQMAGADVCTLYMTDQTGGVLKLIGEHGVGQALKDKIDVITATTGNTDVFARMLSGTAVWAENEEDYRALYPELARITTDGPRAKAFWGVPLTVEGKPVGLLGMGFHQPRRFDDDERAFIETFARLCAQALLRAARRQREDDANRWFTTTLRSIGDAVIATDAAGNVTFMNPIAESLTRWSEQDARGRPLEEVFCIFSEETGLPVESPVSKVLREGKVVGLANHTVLRQKNGVEIPIDDSGAPISGETGALLGVVLVFRDATGEKRERVRREFLAQAGEALVSSSRDYGAILATVARLAVPSLADWCAVDIADSGSTPRQVAVAHVDPVKVQLALALSERYPPAADATTGVPNVIRTGRSELYREIPPALLEAGARDPEHLRTLRELRLESAMVVPLKAQGRSLGAMTFVYADSGRRYTEDDLRFAEDFARRAAMAIENAFALKATEQARLQEGILRGEAESASRAKDEFLATVSHELRTPLNAILGWTVILSRRTKEPEVARGLAIIERNARAQAKLIEDVLDVSRIISGKLALKLGPTNVGQAVAAAIETVTPAAHAKGVTINFDGGERELIITADADRLQQIVWNLLSNAVKFTPKGGQVRLQTERIGSSVRIMVKDTGEGIRAAALPLIFEPFHQADASTTRRHGGLGLGLAIVKQLVTAHGGTVLAESDGIGRGSTFTVQVPAHSLVPALGRPGRPSPPLEFEARGAELETPRLEGLRILVVDDEPDARAMLDEMLTDCGAEVYVAASADEALKKFVQIKPDIIISDIGMPEVDGYSFIGTVRAFPGPHGGTPAIALTAYARSEDAQRAFAAGYHEHVAKPVEPGHLARVVASLAARMLPTA